MPENINTQTRKMQARDFGLGDFKRNRWRATLQEHQTFEQTLEQTFWANQAAAIMGYDKTAPKGVGDIIEVFKPDTQLYAELLIVGIGEGFVKVRKIRMEQELVLELKSDSPLKTRWNPGKKCHEVVRPEGEGAQVTVMAGGFQTKGDAIAWISKHLEQMAA